MNTFEPDVTLLVPAFNEADWIEAKALNCLEIDYPAEKLHLVFVTDGSTDGTETILRNLGGINVLHQPERKGKLAAVDRIIGRINTPIVIFSDANTLVNPMAVRNIVRHFERPEVGAVAGEKRILKKQTDTASGTGEGLYWRYESYLKVMDSELFSVVGAAGELFAIRTELYESVPGDTIIEDFVLSLRIAERGYRVMYEPDAYALETASASVGEEMKRKSRIAAGGFQAIVRLRSLLNPATHGVLSFQYISHRVLRWAVTPFLLPQVFTLNLWLSYSSGGIYTAFALAQIAFYGCALAGWALKEKAMNIKIIFVPMYFVMMNVAVFRGFGRFLKGSQSAVWERAQRNQEALQGASV